MTEAAQQTAGSRRPHVLARAWKRRPLRWVFAALILLGVAQLLQVLGLVSLPGGGIGPLLLGGPHPETERYRARHSGLLLTQGFRSYASIAEVEKRLSAARYTDWFQDARHSKSSPDYPPYDFDSLVVADYRHLDVPGTLSLQFFNDRLFQIEFVPADAEAYARRMGVLKLRSSRNARAERTDGALRIASSVGLAVSKVGQHLKSEPYVIWQDLRLIRQREEWDLHYGAIPRAMAER